MSLMPSKIEMEKLRPGDHIYTWRSGYTYSHHGTCGLASSEPPEQVLHRASYLLEHGFVMFCCTYCFWRMVRNVGNNRDRVVAVEKLNHLSVDTHDIRKNIMEKNNTRWSLSFWQYFAYTIWGIRIWYWTPENKILAWFKSYALDGKGDARKAMVSTSSTPFDGSGYLLFGREAFVYNCMGGGKVMQFGGQHPGGIGVPAVGMAFPGYVAQSQLGLANSEMTCHCSLLDAVVVEQQMLKVAAECHLYGFLHRDMKPEVQVTNGSGSYPFSVDVCRNISVDDFVTV
ncbi:hypothetical protein FNV43_RR08133 [Rhamnella rubrinervis]|uniref:Uncharacterized protein n=1 Tax=Rhamnella rubrinervis TaxID=2594499 RepID=A0A8K0HG75_9ROSA|nr:hypothetical protein FNV43_RR08133 [Rhamnella rubrinervis]